MPRDAVFAYYQHQIGDHFSTQGMRSNNRRRLERNREFVDSPLEGTGFELVWGFSCQVVIFGLLAVLCSERESRSSFRRLAIRFAERAEGVKGPKR